MAPRQVASPTHLECINVLIGQKGHKTKEERRKRKEKEKDGKNTRVTIYATTQTPPHMESMHNASKTHHHLAKINQQST